MKMLVVTSLSFFFSIILFAQEKIYIDSCNNWTNEENATKYALVTKQSRNKIKVEYYTLDNHLKEIIYYSKYKENHLDQIKNGLYHSFYSNGADSLRCIFKNNKPEGQHLIDYPTGEKKLTASFKDGLLHGMLLQYYNNGNIRRKENYEKGECLIGILLDENGAELPFYPYSQQPEFPGGINALMQMLKKIMQYPEYCFRNNIQGRVLVQFIVKKDGNLASPQVVKSANIFLDEEALRTVNVIAALTKWTPGKIEGTPVSVRYTLPLVFRLGPAVITNIR